VLLLIAIFGYFFEVLGESTRLQQSLALVGLVASAADTCSGGLSAFQTSAGTDGSRTNSA
jgi:hypothetical protein